MLDTMFHNLAVAGSVVLAMAFLWEQPANAARFKLDLSYTSSQLLPPWDVPETGTGFFDFDGTNYGKFVITSLVFQNFATFPGNPFFPGGQTEPYPPNTVSPLTPIVFTPETVFTATPTQLSAFGSLDFQTSIGVEPCLTDPIAPGGVLCGAFFPAPLVRFDLTFDTPIFERATNQFLPSNFSWSLATTTDLKLNGLSFPIPAGSIIGAGVNVDRPNPFPGDSGLQVIPANRAVPVPEPSAIFGLIVAGGIGLGRKRNRVAAHSRPARQK